MGAAPMKHLIFTFGVQSLSANHLVGNGIESFFIRVHRCLSVVDFLRYIFGPGMSQIINHRWTRIGLA